MWMDGITLRASIAADGAGDRKAQELRISLHDGTVILKCEGVFEMWMDDDEMNNLYQCIEMLREMAEGE